MTTGFSNNALQPPSWIDSLRRFWVQPSSNPLDLVARIRTIRERGDSYRKLRDVELAGLIGSSMDPPCSEDVNNIALAAGLEATRRILKIDLYDCQLQGALELVSGSIVQLHTGEGKTLVAMLAAVCFAFSGRTPHVMTVNSYLARRDREQLAPVYAAIGLSVGLTDSGMSVEEKRRGYRSHIVYGPGYEFGFDYLRDQLAILSQPKPKLGDRVLQRWRQSDSAKIDPIQNALNVAIVDEADSVMLDEASTPLILSAGQKTLARNAEVYRSAHAVARQLRSGTDYQLSNQDNSFQWTDTGIKKWKQPEASIRKGLERAWSNYLQQAIFATQCLHRDVHYLIQDDKVQLIDQHTGRILLDRSWGAGLQQAVEAKESVSITSENHSLATITRQRFLRVYTTLCGLTGTAEGSENEFKEVYRLKVARVLPHRPSQLKQSTPQLFLDRGTQEAALVATVKACLNRCQPVLVGTTSVQSSERLARVFADAGIGYRLLSGREGSKNADVLTLGGPVGGATGPLEEAEIIAMAGQASAVTIATNIAGRGTDIRLGTGVVEIGGLHVIATELHESQRVERQLMGRAARQGDPGSFELLLSLEDPLMVRVAPDLVRRLRNCLASEPIDRFDWLKELRELQRQLESQRVDERRMMFAHDDWQENVVRELT